MYILYKHNYKIGLYVIKKQIIHLGFPAPSVGDLLI